MTSGPFDLNALFAQAQAMQQQIAQAATAAESARVEGSAGGGLVRATVTGVGELVGLHISPEVLADTDAETLADLVLAAVRHAVASAAEAQEAQEPMTAFEGFGGLEGLLGQGAPANDPDGDVIDAEIVEDEPQTPRSDG